MAITFHHLATPQGVQELDNFLLTRSYISGYQASKDDLAVYLALKDAPSSKFVNASRWYSHISALLRPSFPGESVGVFCGNSASSETREVITAHAAESVAPNTPAPAAEEDDDLDLFGEETEEEKAAAAEREASVKPSAKKKESGKSSVLLDVKPWDDETDMKKLEEAVRSVEMPGLFWGASKLVPVGYGIKKLQIMMTIVDDLVSVDELIEDHLTEGPAAEFIQSCDIAAFNKI
uniref:Elongation factor 1-delta 2-like protein n=1 Tax=Huperzia serrata TaxID=355589 RepID=A0A481ZKM1_HUPSR|nr:elongation factor 1-delta 2-like protein [Huperzia serrata]